MIPSEDFIRREPYFTILTDPRYLSAHRTADAEREFFESGERDVAEMFAIARQRVAANFAPRRALEFGCGIGRIAWALAKRVEHVTAVDRSPAMLAQARRAVNVVYTGAAEGTFDLITCILVLQRLPRQRGLDLLRELLDRLDTGGVLVAQVPFHRPRKPLDALRARVPGLNALVNLARRKPLDTPLVPTTTYDVNELAELIRAAGCSDPYLVFTRNGDTDAVVLYTRRVPPRATAAPAVDETFIDVDELIARSSIDDLNRTAEQYFASLTDWDFHLAKPFSRPEDAPPMLIHLGVLLQGLKLSPGDVVLDFGGGTGWLSRFLTQLGCRAIVCDVSASALNIARALYERMPVAGTQPAPRFLHYDGRRIALDDASVDRIVCFDAFHHAPNPAEVIAEFARILKPGGIAGFAEPGPHHSRTPQSQYEMRTYGVVEADVHIEQLRDAAMREGFAEMRVAALNVPPFHVGVEEYNDLIDGGPTAARWDEWSRAYMRDVRHFFLIKSGQPALASRHSEGLACEIEATLVDPTHVHVRARNSGRATWLPSGVEPGAVNLGCHLYDAHGALLKLDHAWSDLTTDKRAVAPGETVETTMSLPALAPGRYQIELDLVANRVGWFAQFGSKPARLELVSS